MPESKQSRQTSTPDTYQSEIIASLQHLEELVSVLVSQKMPRGTDLSRNSTNFETAIRIK
jgi:hypothetical protein